MESEWVKITPYLGIQLPDTAVNDDFPGVKESKEIYEYFNLRDPQNTIDSFRSFFGGLSSIPRLGQTKVDQVIEAIRLCKLADKIQTQMNEMGIRR